MWEETCFGQYGGDYLQREVVNLDLAHVEELRILAYMAFCEVSQDQSPGTPAAAGDFGFKVLTSSDPAEKTKKLSAELANGRLAMMAIIGMFFQALCKLCMLNRCHVVWDTA